MSVNQELQTAIELLQQGNTSAAKKIAEKLNKKIKNNAVILHLLALIYKQENKLIQARKCFEQSLKLDAKQAPVLVNYANLLLDSMELDKASFYYSKATVINGELEDAWYNWANLLNTLEQYNSAKEKILKAIELNSINSRYHCVLGVALSGLEQFEQAINAFEIAEKFSENIPDKINAVQNKAFTLRTMHQPQQAIACLQKLVTQNIANSDVLYIQACAHYDCDEFDLTEKHLKRSIDLMPENVLAHEALNKLYWESANDKLFLTSYKEAIKTLPESLALKVSYIKQLILTKRYDLAQEELERSFLKLGKQPSLLSIQSQIYLQRNSLDDAQKILKQILKVNNKNVRAQIDLANVHMKKENYSQALMHLNIAGKVDSLNQEVWANKGVCWRLLGDSRSEWLNDYEKFISSEFIEFPEGYDDLEHFLGVLKYTLQGQHKTNRQPLDQSVKNGTQTVGNLLTIQNKVIQEYRVVLTKRIKKYIKKLPRDVDHPFLKRVTNEFKHSGAWSVKLQNGGFHTNHMHPQGWLSNCTYVNVPNNIKVNDKNREGWIKFGETCLNLGEHESIAKHVCPQEGLSVIFPSYFWHGTVPFKAEEFRITLPSDIMPVN